MPNVSAFATLGRPLLSTDDAAEALALGALSNWNVRKAPAYTIDPVSGETLKMPGRNAVLFDHPDTGRPTYLGDVGKAHTTIQNEEMLDLLQLFADEAGATFETAGHAQGGRKVFVTMKLPGNFRVGGVDVVDHYVASIGSHDGSASHMFGVFPMRFACMNMLNVAKRKNAHLIRVRHTKGAKATLHRTAQEILANAFDYLDEFNAMAERMVQTTLTQQRFEEIVYREYGPADDSPTATITRREAKCDEMARLFADAATQEGIRDTVWAGFNAITEWADHYAPTHGDPEQAVRGRAEKALLDPWIKQGAWEMMGALV